MLAAAGIGGTAERSSQTTKQNLVESIGRKMGVVNQDTGTETDWPEIRSNLLRLNDYTLRRLLASLIDQSK